MGGREPEKMTGAAAKVPVPARGRNGRKIVRYFNEDLRDRLRRQFEQPGSLPMVCPFAIGKAFGLAAATHELDACRATILSYMPQQE